jgi:hypothetical protein
LAVAAAACDALIAPNIGRADLPNVVPLKMPWVTWIVAPRIPAASAAGPNDGLLIADASWRRLAREAGWNNDRVEVAAWPKPRSGPRIVSGDRCVALIADTRPIETPPQVTDFSSHRLLWEFIHEELFRDPFIVGGEVETYLDRRMPQFRIGEHGLDRRLFVDLLIVPAFQQSLARILIHEKVPIQLWGKGWDRIEETRSHAAGLVESREELAGIAGSSSALIYSWPSTYAHPIDGTGCPVLKARASRSDFVRRALMALGEKVGRHDGPAETSGPPITGEAVAKFLRRLLATA